MTKRRYLIPEKVDMTIVTPPNEDGIQTRIINGEPQLIKSCSGEPTPSINDDAYIVIEEVERSPEGTPE